MATSRSTKARSLASSGEASTLPPPATETTFNILEPHMPEKGIKDMLEAGIEAAQHKGGGLIRPRQIAHIEEDGCERFLERHRLALQEQMEDFVR